MERVCEHIEDLVERYRGRPDSPFHGEIVQIRFNAWHYIETNLWASLVEHIFTELDNWLRKGENTNQTEKVDALFESLNTSQLLRLEAIDVLVARRQRKMEAAARVAREREAYLEKLQRSEAEHQSDLPWGNVLDSLIEDEARNDLVLKNAAKDLGLYECTEHGVELRRVLEQSADVGGRLRIMASALLVRFGKYWWIFVAETVVAPFVPWLLRTFAKLEIDPLQNLLVSLSTIAGTGVILVGQGLKVVTSALGRIEKARKGLDAKIKQRSVELRKNLTTSEADFAEVKTKLGHAEERLRLAETAVVEAVEALKSGTARGRLNRFIHDSVTSGVYAKHLGLVASIRRDFVKLARLLQVIDETEDEHEPTRFEEEYRHRVQVLIDTVVKDLRARASSEEAESFERKVKAAAGPLWEQKADDTTSANEERNTSQSSCDNPKEEKGDPSTEPLLDIEEIKTLCTGLAQGHLTGIRTFQRIILYIDDLDRCPPDRVVEVLQAAHLLLGFPLFIVLIAVDERWVSRALAHHYAGMLAEPEKRTGSATSHDYLEKIFQIPYQVRPMQKDACEAYLRGLLGPESPAAKLTVMHEDDATPPVRPDASPQQLKITNTKHDSPKNGSPKESLQATAASVPASNREVEVEIEAEIEALSLTKHERRLLVSLAAFAGNSPRRGKRFVNTYRLIKAGIEAEKLDEFVATTGGHCALLVQLAITTGAATEAVRYFELLEHRNLTTVYELIEDIKGLKSGDACERQRILGALEKAKENGVTIDELRSKATCARRYSFVSVHEFPRPIAP